ncbi:hypothetical protein PAECIP111893_03880 [Paenibacillus plantiphilus]|uniref:Uncharacterized protein n=1 Tax=Paenibacillus plantiphilus TaxID=2905650 RepID=A0ABM9CL15_9BACL|nr:hypothetical protein PAECIP111893_03880 [Paenibacillus plantiphilus]
MQEPELGKAMTVLEFLSQDEEARRLYQMRERLCMTRHPYEKAKEKRAKEKVNLRLHPKC